MSLNWKLAYLSEIVDPSAEALADILTRSRRNNHNSGVSGVLLRDRNSFLQVLEGDRRHLGDCMLRIAGDSRHRAVHILLSAPSDVLFFDRWALGHATLPAQKRSLSSYAKMVSDRPVTERLGLISELCLDTTLDRE